VAVRHQNGDQGLPYDGAFLAVLEKQAGETRACVLSWPVLEFRIVCEVNRTGA
jgi:hypothetical protein